MFNAKQELAKLEKAIMETIVVPNEWLPEELHDDVRGGRTLERLEQLCDKRDGVTEHTKKQAAKARNIEKLRKQVEAKSIFHTHKGGTDFVDLDGELDYSGNECDELQLHKNQMALVGGMINGGIIDADELED
jgi:hypothetical protein